MSTESKEYWTITCDQCGKEAKQERRPNSFVFGGWFKLEKRIKGFGDKVKEYDLCSKACVIKKAKRL